MQDLVESRHLHPSILTLCKDPYKTISISEYSKSRVVCASLDGDDHLEDERLKAEALKKGQKRNEAFENHARRIYKRHKNQDYSLLDISSLPTEKGSKKYYKELRDRMQTNTHIVGDLREKF
jgi:hypothetical protein